MSRIPLVPSLFQAMMSGLSQGTTMAHSAAQNAALAAQTTNMQKLLALKQQLQPYQEAQLGAAANASNAATSLTPAKLKMYLAQANAESSGAANKTQLTQAQIKELGAQYNFMNAKQNVINHLLNAGQQTTAPQPSPGMISTSGGGMSSTGLPLAPPTQSMTPTVQPTMTNSPSSTGAASPAMQTAAAIIGMHLPTAQQLETPTEKESIAQQQTTYATNAKLLPQYKVQLQTLFNNMAQLDKMRNIVESPDGSNWYEGGIFGPGSTKVGVFSNDKNRGIFKNTGAGIIASLSKEFGGSHGGGKFLTQTAKTFKPDLDITVGQNAGMLQSQGQNMQNEARDLLQNYVQGGGSINDFPQAQKYLDPDRYKEVVPGTVTGQVRLPDGSIQTMTRAQFNKLKGTS